MAGALALARATVYYNELLLAIFPSIVALGFKVRFWVSRSTATNPNFFKGTAVEHDARKVAMH